MGNTGHRVAGKGIPGEKAVDDTEANEKFIEEEPFQLVPNYSLQALNPPRLGRIYPENPDR